MRIEEKIENGLSILAIYGDIASEEAVELKKMIKPYLEDKKTTGIICNLQNVNHIDSSGVGLLVSIYKKLNDENRKFALTSLNNRHRELINIARLDRFLTVARTNESALKMLLMK